MTTREIIELTKQLVTIPSSADNPAALKEAVSFMMRIVATCPDITIEGFERNGKSSFIAYRGPVRPDKFDILLNAHVDVVPAPPEAFIPVEKDGRLYGRGALDMKGTAMVMADVFCELVNKVPYSLGLEIVSDEELGGYDGAALHIQEGLRSDFVLIGEYSNHPNTIYNAARGLCWTEITFRGKGAHGGHPWKGENALIKASNFAGALLKRFPTPEQETWTTTVNISNLSTPNQTYNSVPDQAVLKADFRFTEEDPAFKNKDTLRAFIAELDPTAELTKIEVFEPAVNVAELNPYVQNLRRALKQITNTEPRFLGRPGGSDGRHFALANVDVVEFGLYGADSHALTEYVELDSFDAYQKTLRAFLTQPIDWPTAKQRSELEPLHHRLLRKLVSIPTISSDLVANNKALEFIADFLQERGMFVERFEHNDHCSIIATTRPGNKRPTVLLSAHTDVVPASPEHFRLQTSEGTFLGRGVLDMKSAIAAYMSVVEALKDDLSVYDFGIMITSDEEIGGADGVKTLVAEHGYQPKVAIVPDGGENWQLEVFSKGVHWVKLTSRGQTSHASRPWEGDSAIHRLLEAITEIRKLTPGNPRPEETFLSVGTITGGTIANQIADQASAMLDIRYGDVSDYWELPLKLKAICQKYDVMMEIVADGLPTATNPENYYVKPFVEILNRITGKKHSTRTNYGVTDGRYFAAFNIPCITIEPPGGGRHCDDEWISIQGFDQFCIILEEYVRQMASQADDQGEIKKQDIARLAARLNADDKPAYIWYATFGSGLSEESFACMIAGGKPRNCQYTYRGCRNTTLPTRNTFISLPYELYFAGDSVAWPGGGQATLEVKSSPKAHTIARAYLITVGQFEDIAAQENYQQQPARLPLARAMRDGHTKITSITGEHVYDELLYCGMQDGLPIFSLTGLRPGQPHQTPSAAYTALLCSGLFQHPAFDAKASANYIATRARITDQHKKRAIVALAESMPSPKLSVPRNRGSTPKKPSKRA